VIKILAADTPKITRGQKIKQQWCPRGGFIWNGRRWQDHHLKCFVSSIPPRTWWESMSCGAGYGWQKSGGANKRTDTKAYTCQQEAT
jgi:hypothetical protein